MSSIGNKIGGIMSKIIDAKVWVGTLSEYNQIKTFLFYYDIYIVITATGTRIMEKCRF